MWRKMRSTSHGGGLAELGHLVEGKLELIKDVVAGLVDARHLAGRAEENAGEKIGERGMVLPVADEALEQIGPAQQRAVEHGRAAEHDVVAAAGADVAAIEQELFRGQIDVARLVVKHLGVALQLGPVGRGLEVDLDDAGVRRDLEVGDARVVRRRVALNAHGQVHLLGHVLDRGGEVEVILGRLRRRHEDVQDALARLGADGGADDVEIRRALRHALVIPRLLAVRGPPS